MTLQYSQVQTTMTSFKTCASMIKWKIFEQFKFSALKLQDLKNDFIFNFDDKMKNLWTVWILCKINQHREDELSKWSFKPVQVAI